MMSRFRSTEASNGGRTVRCLGLACRTAGSGPLCLVATRYAVRADGLSLRSAGREVRQARDVDAWGLG
eukprot:6669379-Pyramimonas_sp.AAC.1